MTIIFASRKKVRQSLEVGFEDSRAVVLSLVRACRWVHLSCIATANR
jgi:hypothetical protein